MIDPPRPVFSFRAELPGGTFLANSDRWLEDVKAAVGETAEMVDSVLGEFELSGYELIVADRECLFDSLVGDAFPDWGGAVAIPALNRIVLKSPMISSTDKPFSSLVAHEYAHLAIHAALAGRAAPRWLDEGLATYLAGDWSYRDFVAITIAAWRVRFVPLARLRRLNTFDEKTARLAYAESYLAIKHLIDYYGVESVRALIASLRDGLTVDDALRETIGANLDGFQTE
ncbi:MAG: peptidase MA family metallohydrolase, partial [Candidatus Zixiibacteriota bacterium]